MIDPLTGLWGMPELRLQLELHLIRGKKLPPAGPNGGLAVGGLILLDLDDFGKINATAGREKGDQLLIATATALLEAASENDFVGRVGDNVFAIFAARAGEADVRTRAEDCVVLARAVGEQLKGANVQLTASVGYAFYPRHARTADSLFAAADGAVFRAKAAGKDGIAEARWLASS